MITCMRTDKQQTVRDRDVDYRQNMQKQIFLRMTDDTFCTSLMYANHQLAVLCICYLNQSLLDHHPLPITMLNLIGGISMEIFCGIVISINNLYLVSY